MNIEREFVAVDADSELFVNPVTDDVVDSIWKANLPSMAFATIRFINGSCKREETDQALQLLHAEGDVLYQSFRLQDRGEHYTIYQILRRQGMLDVSELVPEMMKILNTPTPIKQAWLKSLAVEAASAPSPKGD